VSAFLKSFFLFPFNINSLKKCAFGESFWNGQFASNEIPTTNYNCQKYKNVCFQHETFRAGVSNNEPAVCNSPKCLWMIMHGILSVPGIAGYEWEPARIGYFFNTKYFFHNTNRWLKTGKRGNHSSADTSHVQCSLDKVILKLGLFYPFFVIFQLFKGLLMTKRLVCICSHKRLMKLSYLY